MIYMKGVPDLPRCGFSALAVRVLKEHSKKRNTFVSFKCTIYCVQLQFCIGVFIHLSLFCLSVL